MNVFNKYALKSSITKLNGRSFSYLVGFGMLVSANTRYYVTEPYIYDKIYIFNEEWSYVDQKEFHGVKYMITIDNNFYITGSATLWKTDKDLNVMIQIEKLSPRPCYCGIYYNSTNNLVYFPDYCNKRSIEVYNSNLLQIDTIFLPYSPWSISSYNNHMYVGCDYGKVLVIVNQRIIDTFDGCAGNGIRVTSLLFDQSGYMATSCIYSESTEDSISLFLFKNSNYTGKSLSVAFNPKFIAFDSKGRFIVVSQRQISILN